MRVSLRGPPALPLRVSARYGPRRRCVLWRRRNRTWTEPFRTGCSGTTISVAESAGVAQNEHSKATHAAATAAARANDAARADANDRAIAGPCTQPYTNNDVISDVIGHVVMTYHKPSASR